MILLWYATVHVVSYMYWPHTQAHHIMNIVLHMSRTDLLICYDLTTHNDILLLRTGSLIRFAVANLVDQQRQVLSNWNVRKSSVRTSLNCYAKFDPTMRAVQSCIAVLVSVIFVTNLLNLYFRVFRFIISTLLISSQMNFKQCVKSPLYLHFKKLLLILLTMMNHHVATCRVYMQW